MVDINKIKQQQVAFGGLTSGAKAEKVQKENAQAQKTSIFASNPQGIGKFGTITAAKASPLNNLFAAQSSYNFANSVSSQDTTSAETVKEHVQTTMEALKAEKSEVIGSKFDSDRMFGEAETEALDGDEVQAGDTTGLLEPDGTEGEDGVDNADETEETSNKKKAKKKDKKDDKTKALTFGLGGLAIGAAAMYGLGKVTEKDSVQSLAAKQSKIQAEIEKLEASNKTLGEEKTKQTEIVNKGANKAEEEAKNTYEEAQKTTGEKAQTHTNLVNGRADVAGKVDKANKEVEKAEALEVGEGDGKVTTEFKKSKVDEAKLNKQKAEDELKQHDEKIKTAKKDVEKAKADEAKAKENKEQAKTNYEKEKAAAEKRIKQINSEIEKNNNKITELKRQKEDLGTQIGRIEEDNTKAKNAAKPAQK